MIDNWEDARKILELITPKNGFPLTTRENEAIKFAIKYGDRCAQTTETLHERIAFQKAAIEGREHDWQQMREAWEQSQARCAQAEEQTARLREAIHVRISNLEQIHGPFACCGGYDGMTYQYDMEAAAALNELRQVAALTQKIDKLLGNKS